MAPPKALNVTAAHAHRARGNPVSSMPQSAISNCYPGLEFDLRNIWKHIFVGVELHESGTFGGGHRVVGVDETGRNAGVEFNDRLLSVDGAPVETQIVGAGGQPTQTVRSIEYFNALADLFDKAGALVTCRFLRDNSEGPNGPAPPFFVNADLEVRAMFDQDMIGSELAEPGALTQSLCSPWQADYRECGCYYWAASRPDYVNADPAAGTTGHDWMQQNRTPGAPYDADPAGGGHGSPAHISYDDLYTNWESELKFVVKGQDTE